MTRKSIIGAVTTISRMFLLAAAVVAGWLAYATWRGVGVAGCSTAHACGEVMASRWAYVGGLLPVSLLGVTLYLGTLAAWSKNLTWLSRAGEWTILFAAAWFVSVQVGLIHSYCIWCCAAHGLAVGGVLLRWKFARSSCRGGAESCKSGRFTAVGSAALAVAVMAFAQAYGPRYTSSRVVSVLSVPEAGAQTFTPLLSLAQEGNFSVHGRFTFYPGQLPQIGAATGADFKYSYAAPVLFLHDWTCQHCRELHQHLREKVGKQGNTSFVFVLLPASHGPESREIHRLLLTAWMQRAAVYEQISEEILSGNLAPDPAVLRARLMNILPSFAEKEANYALPVDYLLSLADSVMQVNATRLDVSTLPQLVSTGEILTGIPSDQSLDQFLARAPALPIAAHEHRASALASAPTPGIAANLSRIEFEQTNISLPPVAPGAQVEAIFRFRNTGTEPLDILSVQTTCGCTVVEGWKQTVASGADSSFKVTLSAPATIGPLHKTLAIRTNAANAGMDHSTQLAISTNVSQPTTASTPEHSRGAHSHP
jgi:hypothetical protein